MKILACYSNKGGVGKTASAVNIAHLMAKSGYKVLLVDLDPQGASSFYYRLKPSKKLPNDSFFTRGDKFYKSIQASDYENLDVLPANMDFRGFDVFLSEMKKGQSRLRKVLKGVKKEYDIVLLDCPPTLSLLSENVFECADNILVPVIPTTLTERTLEQLYEFFDDQGYDKSRLLPFFSMVQKSKSLHKETMERIANLYPALLSTSIPFATDVERMGVNRAPLTDFGKSSSAAMFYNKLWREIEALIFPKKKAA
ncbi:ParA family protein [Enterovibrio coralii]|uniref:Cobyrinic acid a,c-diamide synthase n=1 Tax=Enterovibrio coralii TaxID=294935 RepID=A0A135I9G5_9GAMM|nr:AAA family ATPase [Enterovibrio coralii]KXF82093.1 cobyrinic acid a,c-diamide synthase [Enterovibrio coralii]